MNIFVRNNNSIKIGDKVRIDGIDSRRVFEFNAITVYPANYKELVFTLEQISADRYGEMLKLNDGALNGYSWFSRYTLSKVNSPKYLDYDTIKVDNLCMIGKNIIMAPKLKKWTEIIKYVANTAERFTKEESNELYTKVYKIVNIIDEYIIIKDMQNTEQYIFPYWFLYSYNNLYKPKNIIKSFDDF